MDNEFFRLLLNAEFSFAVPGDACQTKRSSDFFNHPVLERAFELLAMQCDVDGGDLLLVPFEGSESVDLSAYYWDFIEDLAYEETPGSMAHGTEVAFHDAGIEVDDGDEEEHHASGAVYDFISEMGDRKITTAELDALITSEGSVDCRDYNGKTPLLKACEGYRWAISQHADAQMEDDRDEGRSRLVRDI